MLAVLLELARRMVLDLMRAMAAQRDPQAVAAE
jgi:hypothetical protein